MSRRNRAVKRIIPPDPRFDSQTVSKFINNLMLDGKKSTAEKSFYQAMDLIESRTGQPGVAVFKQALANVKPSVEVKSRRVGGGPENCSTRCAATHGTGASSNFKPSRRPMTWPGFTRAEAIARFAPPRARNSPYRPGVPSSPSTSGIS